jgi:hypothetical protein
MARDGNGNYSLASGNPVVAGTTITDTWANNTLSDIATALTQSLSRDGQTVPTANLPMATFKHTGAGDASANGQYLVYGQATAASLGGHLGLGGATISAWGSIFKVLQSGTQGFALSGRTDTQQGNVSVNWYFDGTTNKYIANGCATKYAQDNGAHIWSVAPNGTAGSTVTFTQAMTLDNSGNWMLGATSYAVTDRNGALIGTTAGAATWMHATGTSPGSVYQQFAYGGAVIGSITQTGTNAITIGTPGGGMTITSAGALQDSAGNELGYKGVPQNSQGAAYALTSSDRGKHISITTGGVTVPAGVFSVGDAVSVFNNSGSSQTITQGTSVTLYLAGSSSTGNRSLGQRGLCTILCVGANTFVVSGAGLS